MERIEKYIDLIKNSSSLCEVCRKAGIVATTGNYDTLKKIIQEHNLDTSHFKRQHKPIQEHHTLREYLSNQFTITSYRLKRLLLREGLKEALCEKCHRSEWEGEAIPLQLHHKDGNNRNNSFDNLILLCPNCHAQTENYCSRNIRHAHPGVCQWCGGDVKKEDNQFCSAECYYEYIRRNRKKKEVKQEKKQKKESYHSSCPAKDILITDLSCMSMRQIGRKYGVSDKAVCKWLKKYGLPTKTMDITLFLANNHIIDKRRRKK